MVDAVLPRRPPALALVTPAAAIMLGDVAQPLLTQIWPGIKAESLWGFRADSYIPVIVGAALCFVVGYWFGSRKRTTPTAISLAIVPVLWLGLMLWMVHAAGARTFGDFVSSRAACLDLTAVMPLLAIFAGWTARSVGRER